MPEVGLTQFEKKDSCEDAIRRFEVILNEYRPTRTKTDSGKKDFTAKEISTIRCCIENIIGRIDKYEDGNNYRVDLLAKDEASKSSQALQRGLDKAAEAEARLKKFITALDQPGLTAADRKILEKTLRLAARDLSEAYGGVNEARNSYMGRESMKDVLNDQGNEMFKLANDFYKLEAAINRVLAQIPKLKKLK